jgi:uncharacterized protein (TIGR03663 family)
MGLADDTAAAQRGAFADRLSLSKVDRLTLAVGGITVLALVARLAFLGKRIAHWDEARVAYWIFDYWQTGAFEYRPIIHGPFYHHINATLFELFGPSDTMMRLAVAIIGGLLPLSALLLRDRLRDSEVVALAFFLGANSLLLYYSRFMRGDPLVASFMFVAFALFVRAGDTGRRGYFFAGIASMALGFTAKENALIYVVTWIGAVGLLLDHRLFLARGTDTAWPDLLIEYLWASWRFLRSWLLAIVIGVVEFFAIIVFFYAPRNPDGNQPGFREAFSDPTVLPAVIEEATVGSWQKFYSLWVQGGHQDHAYIPFFGDLLQTLWYGGLAICLVSILGFIVDRYSRGEPRDVVSFAFYWGFVSVLGYPLVTDIKAPWAGMHVVTPLAIPAAVGVALIYRWGREAYDDTDYVSVGLAALLLLLIGGQVVGASTQNVYLNPQSDDNKIIQYAQPADDVRPTLAEMETLASDNPGTDVLLHGEFYVDGDSTATRHPPCAKWFNALPLPWYFKIYDVNVDCAKDNAQLNEKLKTEPPMVITRQSNAATVREQLPDYQATTYRMRTFGTDTTFFVHPEYATGTGGNTDFEENSNPGPGPGPVDDGGPGAN